MSLALKTRAQFSDAERLNWSDDVALTALLHLIGSTATLVYKVKRLLEVERSTESDELHAVQTDELKGGMEDTEKDNTLSPSTAILEGLDSSAVALPNMVAEHSLWPVMAPTCADSTVLTLKGITPGMNDTMCTTQNNPIVYTSTPSQNTTIVGEGAESINESRIDCSRGFLQSAREYGVPELHRPWNSSSVTEKQDQPHLLLGRNSSRDDNSLDDFRGNVQD